MATEKSTSKEMGKRMSSHNGGHLVMQANEIRNSVIHYHRLTDGTLGWGLRLVIQNAAKIRVTPRGAIMKSSKLLGRSICGSVMVLFTSFFAMDVSLAADKPTEKRITKLFLTSGQVDLAREVVKLPLHRGRLSSGEIVWFVLTDVSDLATSKKMGLTWAPSLSKAKNLASTRVAEMDESNNFTFKSGRVDFSPTQTLAAGEAPNFFPPRMARAGSIGDAHYSPLVRVANRNDIVFNAPMIAFNVGPEKISFCGGNPDYSVVTDSVANICPEK